MVETSCFLFKMEFLSLFSVHTKNEMRVSYLTKKDTIIRQANGTQRESESQLGVKITILQVGFDIFF